MYTSQVLYSYLWIIPQYHITNTGYIPYMDCGISTKYLTCTHKICACHIINTSCIRYKDWCISTNYSTRTPKIGVDDTSTIPVVPDIRIVISVQSTLLVTCADTTNAVLAVYACKWQFCGVCGFYCKKEFVQQQIFQTDYNEAKVLLYCKNSFLALISLVAWLETHWFTFNYCSHCTLNSLMCKKKTTPTRKWEVFTSLFLFLTVFILCCSNLKH